MRNEAKIKIQIPEREQFLLFLHSQMLYTGRVDIMYCNSFLSEAIQLLINSIFLYEEGYFDCAFYSVRQASEVLNSMLYLSVEDKTTLKKWSAKEYFPMNNKIKMKLEKLSNAYKEIKCLLPDYFQRHSELIKKSNKIIHKQGFDTFYRIRTGFGNKHEYSLEEEKNLFVETLKYTIGIALIHFIILDPISLALIDDEVTYKLNFNFMTEPVDISFFDEFLGKNDIIPKIMKSNFYQEFKSYFSSQEEMLPAVFSVVREEAWDLNSLDEIESQLHLLNAYERFMFIILKNGVQVSRFYMYNGLTWYFTSIKSNYNRSRYGGEEFQNFLKSENKFNQPCSNVFMSVIMMYDEPLYIEHNKILSVGEIEILKAIEIRGKQELEKFNNL